MSKQTPISERNPNPGKLIDLTRRKFGRLVAEYRNGTHKTGEAKWHCLCDCGNSKDIVGQSLRNGDTKSCGCLAKELTGNRARKHGQSKNPRHKLWIKARQRATKKGIPFNITWEDIPEIPIKCSILNIELSKGTRGKCSNSPSLDKINPIKGYVKGNIRIISHRANQLKSDGTPEELMLVAKDAMSLGQVSSQ